jgi:predicted nucleic acid-binding protein
VLWIFFDASALVKRYVPEVGTDVVNESFRLVPLDQMACSRLGVLELVSILQRKRNVDRITNALYQQVFVELDAEILQAEGFAITSTDIFDLSGTINFIVAHNINATDAVILRSALTLQQTLRASGDDIVLRTADKRLARAAQAEDVTIIAPEASTLAEVQRLFATETS